MSSEVRDSQDFDKVPEEESKEILGDLAGSLWRCRWWFGVPAALIAVGVCAGSLRLPNVYQSDATIGLVEQQISERFVAADERPADEAVDKMTRQILSRTSLVRVVAEMGLYPEDKGASPEDIADRMQSDLSLQPLLNPSNKAVGALRISYKAFDPLVAQRVADRLATLFMEENRKMRGGKIQSESSFISAEVQAAKAQLDKQDAWLQSFKSRNLGQLPEQQAGNLQALADLRTRAQSISGEIERAQRELRGLETSVADRLAALQSARAELLVKFAPRHQEVLKKDAEIAKYQALADFINSGGTQPGSRQTLATVDDATVSSIRNRLTAGLEAIESLNKQEAQLRSEIDRYQSRVNSAPLREQELSQAMRDYNIQKEAYNSLKNKELQQNLAETVEEREEGQQFRLLDSASLPVRPIGPNRLKLSLAGVLGGVIFGLILALVVDKAKDTFHSEKAVAVAFRIPLVLGVPIIDTPRERRAARRWVIFEWAAAVILTVCVISAELYVYVRS